MENNNPPEVPANVPRVARCMVCSNEWVARDGSKDKPSRCPECKSRNVKWRDLCEDEVPKLTENTTEAAEIITETAEEPTETPEEKPEKVTAKSSAAVRRKKEEEEEVSLEEITEKMKGGINPKFIVWVIGGIGLIGVSLMVFRERKERMCKAERERQRMEEEKRAANVAPLELLRYRVTGSGGVF